MPASLRPTPAAITARHPMRSTGWHPSVKRTPLSSSLRHSMMKIPTPIARCRRWSRRWTLAQPIRDIARSQSDFRFREKSGHAAGITGMAELDPQETLKALYCDLHHSQSAILQICNATIENTAEDHMTRGDIAGEYRRLNAEDQSVFRKWLIANTVFGAVAMFALIAAAVYSGGDSGTMTAQKGQLII